MGINDREMLDSVGRGHVVPDPAALAGQFRGVDNNGGVALMNDVVAAADPSVEVGVRQVAPPVEMR